jgi:uncharacterized protein
MAINDRDEVGATQLFDAVTDAAIRPSNKAVRRVKELLSQGADPNIGENNGITPLMQAASGGARELAKLLLENGADLTARDHFGDDAADYADAQNHFSLAKFLRQKSKRDERTS